MSKSIKNKFYVGETVEFVPAYDLNSQTGVIRGITLLSGDSKIAYSIHTKTWHYSYVDESNIRRIIPKFKPGDRVIVKGYPRPVVIESVNSSAPNQYWVKYFSNTIHANKMTLAPDVIEFGECG